MNYGNQVLLLHYGHVICLTDRTGHISNAGQWNEADHPRKKDGKFEKSGGTMTPVHPQIKPKTLKQQKVKTVQTLTGKELAPFNSSIEELREKASRYYQKELNGKSFENHKLGLIKFSDNAGKKPLSFSGNPEKLRVVPALKEIIKKGEPSKPEPDRYKRPNVKAVYTIKANVLLNGKDVSVGVNIREDNNGKLYYDHYIVKAL